MFNARPGLLVVSLAAVLLAGSCAAPINDGSGLVADGAANHPITVEPTTKSLSLPFSRSDAGLMPDDAARFEAFVGAYLAGGEGSISVSAPDGADYRAAIEYFGERLTAMGVPRSRILVGRHDAPAGDTHVELDYVGYVARTNPCGDWSKNMADVSDNRATADFGCSVQHNIAAMVADPRDLLGPRPETPSDRGRRTAVFDNYQKGDPTAARQSKDQSGAVSDVNK